MAMTRVNGLYYPQPHIYLMTGFAGPGVNQVIDATGEKMAWVGQVRWFDGDNTKAIRKFHFAPRTVVSAGGSVMQCSLQDVDLTTGNPARPDGVVDQSCTFSLSTVPSDSWFTCPAFDSDRTVSRGDWVTVVIEYDSGGRLGADALNFHHSPITNGPSIPGIGSMVLFQSGFWSTNFSGGAWGQSMCALEFSDGTFGCIGNSTPNAFSSGTNYNTSTTFDEYAMRFQMPFDCTIDGALMAIGSGGPGSNRGVTLNLYDASFNVLAGPILLDSEFSTSVLSSRFDIGFPEVALTKNTTYYMASKANTTGNVGISRQSMITVPMADAMEGGNQFYLASRKGGAWTHDTSLRPFFSFRISKIGNGSA